MKLLKVKILFLRLNLNLNLIFFLQIFVVFLAIFALTKACNETNNCCPKYPAQATFIKFLENFNEILCDAIEEAKVHPGSYDFWIHFLINLNKLLECTINEKEIGLQGSYIDSKAFKKFLADIIKDDDKFLQRISKKDFVVALIKLMEDFKKSFEKFKGKFEKLDTSKDLAVIFNNGATKNYVKNLIKLLENAKEQLEHPSNDAREILVNLLNSVKEQAKTWYFKNIILCLKCLKKVNCETNNVSQ